MVTPLLRVILLLFANDFVITSAAADNVRPSPHPDRWQVRAMTKTALAQGLPLLLTTLGIFYWGRDLVKLSSAQLQTLSFLTLIFTAQGTIYLVHERQHVWASRPSAWMILASASAVGTAVVLAANGVGVVVLPRRFIGLDFPPVGAALVVLNPHKAAVLCRQPKAV